MPETTYIAVFLAGLLGGGHCVAMCGGVLGALSVQGRTGLGLQVAYNAGRIGSYAAAGALAGAVGSLILLKDVLSLQIALYALANGLLVLVGLYLAGWSGLITRLEWPGRWLWRQISPLTRKFLPADTIPRALAVGAIWGWLPCGLTYSVLAIALMGADSAGGAALMAAFGLGTLPNLVAAGMLIQRLRPWLTSRFGRRIAGGLVLGFGLAGLAHATQLGDQLRRGLLCIT